MRKRNRIAGQFAARRIAMMESPAFGALSLGAHRVLARLEIELAHHGGNDNGKLPVTFDQFEDFGVHRHSIAPAIRELVQLGFVEVTEAGRAGNAEWRRPNFFRLTYLPVGNASPTDEWRRVITKETAELIARAARQSKPSKEKSPVAVSAKSQCGNRHRKAQIHSAETITTGRSAETATTSIISGKSP
jgi:hypothetical protein